MADVFISSVQSGFEDVRTGARSGVESFGHRAVMAETTGAAAASPQRALLDRVAVADIFLLLVGPRYGALQSRGVGQTASRSRSRIQRVSAASWLAERPWFER